MTMAIACSNCAQVFYTETQVYRCPTCQQAHEDLLLPTLTAIAEAHEAGETEVSVEFTSVPQLAEVGGILESVGVASSMVMEDGRTYLACSWPQGLERLRKARL